MSAFKFDEFVESPSLEAIEDCEVKKADWVQLARHFNVTIRAAWRKNEIKKAVIAHLVSSGLLEDDALMLCDSDDKSLRVMEIELEREKMKDRERERNFQLQLMERKRELRLQELDFDPSRVIRFVPNFDESDPEEFFGQFEHVASTLKWPRDYWPILVQSSLKGKGRSVYLSLAGSHQSDYDTMKDAILKAYQLSAEYYRNRFRNCIKEQNQSFVEYMHKISKLQTRWLSASNVNDYNKFKELVLLEQFIRGVSPEIRMYLLEREVSTVERAALLAENFNLISKSKVNVSKCSHPSAFAPSVDGKSVGQNSLNSDFVAKKSGYGKGTGSGWSSGCFYCKKPDHIKANCPKLMRKGQVSEPKPVANYTFVSTDNVQDLSQRTSSDHGSFQPFIFSGSVALDEASPSVPVSVFRDTGASHSVVLKEAVPFLEDAYTGKYVVVEGFGGCVTVPLCKLYLRTDLVSGPVVVGVHDSLPIKGVSFLMGNDIAGIRLLPNPVVCPFPVAYDPAVDVARINPGLFPACAVTRSQAKKLPRLSDRSVGQNELGLECLFGDEAAVEVNNEAVVEVNDEAVVEVNDEAAVEVNDEAAVEVNDEATVEVNDEAVIEGSDDIGEVINVDEVSITSRMLIEAQKSDESLRSLRNTAVSKSEVQSLPSGYYLNSGILMRKYRPPEVPATDSWHEVFQVVVPTCYRPKVISLAHDLGGGHLGIKKTLDKVLRYFYWPGVTSDVTRYCRTCDICQRVGKPNQVIPPAPLKPIPAFEEPFSRVIIDCVGPLPRTKSGNRFLLTLMCASTRYPEAIPLKRATSRTIVPVLIKFFTQYGMPRVLQSDQGSNFWSVMFQEVMKLLHVKQYSATAYRPQTQGALERYHQTLKSMLTKYCHETGSEWDLGVPLMLYAIRCTKQESLRFSPYELLFGRDIRGPMKLLYESWIGIENSGSLSDYVVKMKTRLQHLQEFAHKNLERAQCSMKGTYDRNAIEREFGIGEKVLLFLPVRKQPLTAKYQGPFKVLEKINDINYVIATPGRRKKKKVVHINLLKKYHPRRPEAASALCAIFVPEERGDTAASPEMESDFDVGDVGFKLQNSDILKNPNSKISHLSHEQQQDILCVLQQFSDVLGDIPRQTHLVTHDVKLVDGAIPVKQAPYRMSPYKAKIMEEEVSFLLKNGLAELSESEWASPCALVPKSKGWRMVTDYRRINELTKGDCYPLPRILDIIDAIGESKFITVIDLLKGYYQVPLSPEAKQITAFVTPNGLYNYCVLPFGLKNAPSSFQRLTGSIIRDLKGVKVYIDDLVVYSRNWEDHVATLRSLFERLQDAGLTVNLVKSEFAQAKVDASDVAAGSVLLQEGKDGVLHPVCYSSAKFKPHQTHYSTIEKEAAALLMALEKFDVYLSCTPYEIEVFSDHNPLQFVMRMKNKNQRLTRWYLALQPYNLVVKHIKGRNNIIADSLSRPG
ncbi:uncharacterized protein [Penaeus vannamei]|uniref:uncharacterized protein isoform X1 n=1 Tax=Penaeus vannamei TaxID=6689 RepID=UPI00387F4424